MTRELQPRSSDPTYPDRTWVRVRDPLDEPEFYCLDVPGFGANAQLQAALMAHTCKPNAPDDELFAPDPATGQFRMPACDLCLAAARAGSVLRSMPCAAQTLQAFDMDADGRLRLAAADHLCLAVASGQGAPAGGRSHMRRDVRLENCQTGVPALTQWVLPGLQAALSPVPPKGNEALPPALIARDVPLGLRSAE